MSHKNGGNKLSPEEAEVLIAQSMSVDRNWTAYKKRQAREHEQAEMAHKLERAGALLEELAGHAQNGIKEESESHYLQRVDLADGRFVIEQSVDPHRKAPDMIEALEAGNEALRGLLKANRIRLIDNGSQTSGFADRHTITIDPMQPEFFDHLVTAVTTERFEEENPSANGATNGTDGDKALEVKRQRIHGEVEQFLSNGQGRNGVGV